MRRGLIHIIHCKVYYSRPAFYLRAWLYVRFFIRYEMAGCAIEAKVREGLK